MSDFSPEAPVYPEDAPLQSLIGAPSSIPTDYVPTGDSLLPDAPLNAATEDDPRAVLQRYWGHPDFRGIQRDIIESILSGRDTVGLMPTGGGKSITFQVPALMMEGTCLVITPLIALMKDQVANLRQRGILATAIHSGMSRNDILRELDNVILGQYKFLYLSPERIHTEIFLVKLHQMQVSFITVDEAHCISQWGFDFRPSYLQVSALRAELPGTPILALTATATPTVLNDIQEQLGFREKCVFRMSFERPNISYQVLQSHDKIGDLVQLLQTSEGSAIVYTRSRSGTRDTALTLESVGISALYYHAGLSAADKDARQEAWQTGRTRVMVATNAFGMGIDKADVRLVVHLDLPDSIEAYFQEAGRAGRDGRPARALLLYNAHDHRLLAQRIPQTFPAKERIYAIYDDVACYYQMAAGDGEGAVLEFDLDKFCRVFHHFPVVVVNAFTILQRAGYLEYTDAEDTRSRLMMITQRDALYDYDSHNERAEAVLTALLRQYSGLFSDYVFIDESLLGKACGLTEDEVYPILMDLNRARILHYIPRKSVAHITYLCRRIEPSRLYLSSEVYEERLQQFEHRIHSMLRYCTDSDTCRSVQLLEYFDDHSAHPCGHCDVCDEASTHLHSAAEIEQIILHTLGDGAPHAATDFGLRHNDAELAGKIIDQLLDSGRIAFRHGQFSLC